MESDNGSTSREQLKRQAAEQAAALVQSGMAVGLGTGSTATYAIAALIARARDEGLRIVCVATSDRSAAQAAAGGLVLTDLAARPELDLTIDGADQVQIPALALIKGLGGALLREKIVAAASRRLIIVVDGAKLAPVLDLAVPVEIVRFGWQSTLRHIAALGAKPQPRQASDGTPFVTDGGNLILDCGFGALADPAETDARLHGIVGVIETGLFIGRAECVLVADAGGVHRLLPG